MEQSKSPRKFEPGGYGGRVLKVGALTGGDSEEECERRVEIFFVEGDLKVKNPFFFEPNLSTFINYQMYRYYKHQKVDSRTIHDDPHHHRRRYVLCYEHQHCAPFSHEQFQQYQRKSSGL